MLIAYKQMQLNRDISENMATLYLYLLVLPSFDPINLSSCPIKPTKFRACPLIWGAANLVFKVLRVTRTSE